MNSLAVLTDAKEMEIFKVLGADVIYCDDRLEQLKFLYNLASNYKFIIVSDNIAKNFEKEIMSFDKSVYPIILSLPSSSNNSGFALKSLAKRAKSVLKVDLKE